MSGFWVPLDIQLAQTGLFLTLAGLWVGALNWVPFGRALDRRIFLLINRLPAVPEVDWVMWSITHLGSAWGGVAILAFAIQVRQPRFGQVTGLAFLTVGIIIGVSKALTQRRRPFTQLKDVRVVGLRPADLSYPSGHSAMAFTAATLMALGLPVAWPLRVAFYAVAACVGYSRLHLGVHFPLDVLSGATLGTGWGLVWVSFLYR
jgi:undecaprenyl-diphosphatase